MRIGTPKQARLLRLRQQLSSSYRFSAFEGSIANLSHFDLDYFTSLQLNLLR